MVLAEAVVTVRAASKRLFIAFMAAPRRLNRPLLMVTLHLSCILHTILSKTLNDFCMPIVITDISPYKDDWKGRLAGRPPAGRPQGSIPFTSRCRQEGQGADGAREGALRLSLL